MVHIRIISESEATGELSRIYEKIATSRGGVAEVLKVHSLLPQTMEDHFNLYKTLMFETRSTGLSRKLLEMIAVIVSATNKCNYCVSHHSASLSKFVKDDELMAAIRKPDWQHLTRMLDAKTVKTLLLSEKITTTPHTVTDTDIQELKTIGYNDVQILHIILVINYFNFVNRNVLALGVELEPDFEKTCK